jgi:hypothetical protein
MSDITGAITEQKNEYCMQVIIYGKKWTVSLMEVTTSVPFECKIL